MWAIWSIRPIGAECTSGLMLTDLRQDDAGPHLSVAHLVARHLNLGAASARRLAIPPEEVARVAGSSINAGGLAAPHGNLDTTHGVPLAQGVSARWHR